MGKEEKEQNEKKRLTEEQKFFALGKRLLAHYKSIEQERPLTKDEERDLNKIKEELWNKIVLYAKSLCAQRMSKYLLPSDAYSDALQSCAAQFFRYLDAYDPYRHTPSTYFMYRFQEVISEYLRKDSQHLTQNDANNLGKVRKAIFNYEKAKIPWDINMIARKTGLSEKVVRQTIHIGKNSVYADIDSCYDVASKLPTPEENFLSNEKSLEIAQAIRETLTDDEYEFFMCRMNLDEHKERTYKEMSEIYPDVDVKAQWSKIIGKLHTNSTLNSYSRNDNATKKPRIALHCNEADEVEKDMLAAIQEGLF